MITPRCFARNTTKLRARKRQSCEPKPTAKADVRASTPDASAMALNYNHATNGPRAVRYNREDSSND